MKILIQRVTEANVKVENEIVGKIGVGVVVLIGVKSGDTAAQAIWLANKLVNLRIFSDASGKINQSLIEKKGAALIVSQFTLYADCNAGRRPSFSQAAPPEIARQLYEQFVEEVRKDGIPTETGIFGAEMKVSLINDGPVTLILEHDCSPRVI